LTSVLLFTAMMLLGDLFSADIDLCCSVESACGPTVPRPESYEGWNLNSGNYLFTTDTK